MNHVPMVFLLVPTEQREFLLTNHFYSQHGVDVSKDTAGSGAINKVTLS